MQVGARKLAVFVFKIQILIVNHIDSGTRQRVKRQICAIGDHMIRVAKTVHRRRADPNEWLFNGHPLETAEKRRL